MVDTPICISNKVICVCMASLLPLFFCCWHFHCHRDFWKATKAILNYLFSSRKLLLLPCMIPRSFKMDNVLYQTQIAICHFSCINSVVTANLYGVLLPYPWRIWASQETDYHIIRHIGPKYEIVPFLITHNIHKCHPHATKIFGITEVGHFIKPIKSSFFFFVSCLL